jgi:demethylmenaquinone methyltransferase/2-methoxy-6-polyprenyl-1,4-benzoquinol methylase
MMVISCMVSPLSEGRFSPGAGALPTGAAPLYCAATSAAVPRMSAPDPLRALELYRACAPGYDDSARRTMGLRRRTIDALGLRPGDTVLDVACGTGLSFGLLREGVGADGHVIGIELSPEMLAQAEARRVREGWENVSVLGAAMEDAVIPRPLDAVLFNFTHDVLQSARALDRIFAAARPDVRIAAAGMKWAPWWMAPVNVIVRAQARPYMTTFEGLDQPWRLLAARLVRFDWQPVLFGTGYVGWGAGRASP